MNTRARFFFFFFCTARKAVVVTFEIAGIDRGSFSSCANDISVVQKFGLLCT